MLELQLMTEAEFESYKSWEIEDYAQEISKNYLLPIEESRLEAEKQINEMLGQGVLTPRQFLYMIVHLTENSRSNLGYLWVVLDEERKRCFIADIYFHPEFRRQGWGRKVLELLEIKVKSCGVNRISLHVFVNNRIAQDLYTKMGYQVTGLNMQKWLDD